MLPLDYDVIVTAEACGPPRKSPGDGTFPRKRARAQGGPADQGHKRLILLNWRARLDSNQ